MSNIMTKTQQALSDELDQLIERNYYSEEWELKSAVKLYYDALEAGEQVTFTKMFVLRMLRDPSVANISISTSIRSPEVAALIAEALGREKKASYTSRTMMYALRPYGDEVSFRAVERFVDSEQEIEALRILCSMDFVRAAPHIRRALKRDALLEVCLHIFQDRRRSVGMDQLIRELSQLIKGRTGYYRQRLEAMFTIKKGDNAPFDAQQVRRIITEI